MPAAIDLTGQQIHYLFVEEFVGKKKGSRVYRSRCVCGNTRENTVSELRSGTVKSCGCIKSSGYDHLEDLTGQVFGKWTVLSKAKRGFLCRCVCGTERAVQRSYLVNGESKSCSPKCSKFIEIEVGEQSKFFTYVEEAGYNVAHKRLVVVDCVCGTRKTITFEDFAGNQVLSCGCYKNRLARDRVRNYNLGKVSYNRKDYTNQKYNLLTAVSFVETRGSNKKSIWKFKCDCGGEYVGAISDVRAGLVKGCWKCRTFRNSAAAKAARANPNSKY